MLRAAANEELQKALADHLEETKTQVAWLEQVLENLDASPGRKKCRGMQGIVEEAEELLGEIEILQKLGERRKQLEERERQLQMREDLLQASESRIAKRVDELKSIDDQIGAAAKAKEDRKVQELADLVKMYEAMKAKDAARVFDKLEINLLGDIARQMNPKKLADVVAKMSAEQAEKLTVELANRRNREPTPSQPGQLPKIQGRSG